MKISSLFTLVLLCIISYSCGGKSKSGKEKDQESQPTEVIEPIECESAENCVDGELTVEPPPEEKPEGEITDPGSLGSQQGFLIEVLRNLPHDPASGTPMLNSFMSPSESQLAYISIQGKSGVSFFHTLTFAGEDEIKTESETMDLEGSQPTSIFHLTESRYLLAMVTPEANTKIAIVDRSADAEIYLNSLLDLGKRQLVHTAINADNTAAILLVRSAKSGGQSMINIDLETGISVETPLYLENVAKNAEKTNWEYQKVFAMDTLYALRYASNDEAFQLVRLESDSKEETFEVTEIHFPNLSRDSILDAQQIDSEHILFQLAPSIKDNSKTESLLWVIYNKASKQLSRLQLKETSNISLFSVKSIQALGDGKIVVATDSNDQKIEKESTIKIWYASLHEAK